MSNSTDLQGNTQNFPTHEEIEKRAFDLYLKTGEEFSATEYWLGAEEELKKERTAAYAKPPKGRTAAAGAARVSVRREN